MALVTIMALSFGGYTFAKRAVTSHVYVTTCGKLDYKPAILIKFCADTAVEIAQIEWSTWSANGGTGTGIYVINDCAPTCFDGQWHSAKVKILLSKGKIIDGKEVLTFITVTTQDGENLPLTQSSADAWSLELAG